MSGSERSEATPESFSVDTPEEGAERSEATSRETVTRLESSITLPGEGFVAVQIPRGASVRFVSRARVTLGSVLRRSEEF